jgi:hypothetical protein
MGGIMVSKTPAQAPTVVPEDSQELSGEQIKAAASEAVEQGGDIHDKVYRLTLQALTKRRFDRRGLREVVRAVTEGVAHGAERGGGDVREALADGFRGIDQALVKSAEAGNAALKELVASSKAFSDHDFRQALANLRKLEDDFLATVEQVADAASGRVGPELRKVLSAARHAGTDTGKQVARTTGEFAQRLAAASFDATMAGLEAAGEFGARFAKVAGGILAGVADALRPPQSAEQEGDRKES